MDNRIDFAEGTEELVAQYSFGKRSEPAARSRI